MITSIDRSDSNEFYKARGLKRVSVTLSEGTLSFLEDKRQEFNAIKVTKHGDVVDALVSVYLDNPQFAAEVDAVVREILNQKVVQKAGRKEGWRKEKAEEAKQGKGA